MYTIDSTASSTTRKSRKARARKRVRHFIVQTSEFKRICVFYSSEMDDARHDALIIIVDDYDEVRVATSGEAIVCSN